MDKSFETLQEEEILNIYEHQYVNNRNPNAKPELFLIINSSTTIFILKEASNLDQFSTLAYFDQQPLKNSMYNGLREEIGVPCCYGDGRFYYGDGHQVQSIKPQGDQLQYKGEEYMLEKDLMNNHCVVTEIKIYNNYLILGVSDGFMLIYNFKSNKTVRIKCF